MFKVIGGDYKAENVTFHASTSDGWPVFILKEADGKTRTLDLKLSILSATITKSEGTEHTVHIKLFDGKTIIARVDEAQLKAIQKAVVIEKTSPLSVAVTALVLLGVIGALLYGCIGGSEEQPSLQVSAESHVASQTIDPLDALKAFETFLTSAEQDFKTKNPSDSDLDTIRKTLVLFSSIANQLDILHQKKASLTAEELKYMQGVEKRLSALQQRTLSGLRSAFCKRSASMLWEQDIVVRCLGAGNTTITFTGWLFASNSEIKKVQEQLGDRLTELRFKLSRYQPHEDAKGWQNTLKTPPDAAVRMFKFGGFEELAK